MSLNIKNREVYELASELAALTGSTMTAVVLDALRRQQERLRQAQPQEARVQDLLAIARRCAAHIRQPVTAQAHGDLLYDERGLPQ
jgi:antitoxin VapB